MNKELEQAKTEQQFQAVQKQMSIINDIKNDFFLRNVHRNPSKEDITSLMNNIVKHISLVKYDEIIDTFENPRMRSAFRWAVSHTEIHDAAKQLVELYNPDYRTAAQRLIMMKYSALD